jgi:hypothetical protein
MKVIICAIIVLGALNSACAGSIVRDGRVWYVDPSALSHDQREAIEIARAYIDKQKPDEMTHRLYGGIIDDMGSEWAVSFYPSPTDRERSAPNDDNIIIYVDKRLKRVNRTLLGQ